MEKAENEMKVLEEKLAYQERYADSIISEQNRKNREIEEYKATIK